MKKQTERWIKKAEDDFRVARREFDSDSPVFDAVCFHCQQCVEKYLKAVLQENGIVFEKTHDLDVLLEKCKSNIPDLISLKKELVELSSFAVEIRYPGIDATVEEANDFLSLTGEVRKRIRKFLNILG